MTLSLNSSSAVSLLGFFGSIPKKVERETSIDSQVSVDESADLMNRVRSGDETALTKLIDRWKTPLFRFFHRSLRSHADSEELTQQVFIKLHGSAHRYKPTAKFSTYLFTIARNLLLDEIKRRESPTRRYRRSCRIEHGDSWSRSTRRNRGGFGDLPRSLAGNSSHRFVA